ncbi:hypothetical protein B0A70_09985 [Chryseobacterium piscicola]|uniref:Uncharacterized protein n=1 Tax=Chryseobacterium piscicola TaxID=551459 RepID=A0A2S7KE22_9FLAO|nr:hypothetical protein B0A70_09985 [Chryseobacterium piscicola]
MEDVLLNAFLKCFNKINACNDCKSFPFWLRKNVVNDSITFVRKSKNILYADKYSDEELNGNLIEINLEEIFSQMPTNYFWVES